MSAESRVVGSFLGCAVGDALGAQVEFLKWPAIEQRYGPAGVATFDGAGRITDDTQMALFTAEGLIRGANRSIDRGYLGDPPYPRVDATSGGTLHHAYLRWLSTQGDAVRLPFDRGWLIEQPELHQIRAPGNTCLSALRSGKAGSVEEPINNSKGCGGVMRVHPVGLVAGDRAFVVGAESAALTHGHVTGYVAAGAFASIVAGIIGGGDLRAAVRDASWRLTSWGVGTEQTSSAIEQALELADAEPTPSSDTISELGEGWIAEEALAIALYCALTAEDVRSGIVAAVNHSGDSDSTGALAGALLGTMHGANAVPSEWVESLAERQVIETVARDLHAHFPDAPVGMAFDVERYPPN